MLQRKEHSGIIQSVHVTKFTRTTLDRIVTNSMLVYFMCVLYHLPMTEKNTEILRSRLRKTDIIEKFLTK